MLNILVIKRDGSEEIFDRDKISESIFGAAMSVGGEDMELSEELADKVLDLLESNNIQEVTSDDLQKIVEDMLINEGHAATARQYILKGADRKRIRELDTSLIKSFEELTFKSAEESDTQRENANIDSSTSMGTMLKYGSEAAKSFNLSYLLSDEVSNAHKNCDIHIHDLDFLALTSTCVCEDTLITLKIKDEVRVIKIKDFEKLINLNADVDTPVDISNMNIFVMSKGEFTRVRYYCKHNVNNRKVLSIRTKSSKLEVTGDHKIPIEHNDNEKVVEAIEIQKEDVLMYPGVNIDRYTLDKVDLIELFKGNNSIIIHNTSDVIENIKSIGNWKAFCTQIGYSARANSIRYGKSYLSLQEYIGIERFTSMSREDLKLAYKRTRKDTCIPAILRLTKELGRFMGLMFSEGSLSESILSKQDSNSKAACFCNYDKKLIDNFNSCVTKVFSNIEIHDRKQGEKLAGTQLPGYITYELFKGPLGIKNGAGDMKIPEWMFTANKEFISGFLGGYLDGDGNIQKDSYRVQLTSACKEFLEQLQHILVLRGIGSEIVTINTAGTVATFDNGKYGINESVRNFDTHRLVITGNLKQAIGWWESLKINSCTLLNSNRDEEKYKKVKNIEFIEGYNKYVYDLTTDNSYFDANGITVHNCDQIPLDVLFNNGFNTGHGFLREPGNIRTAAALTAIALQSNQNDQHGGQSIPMLDYYLSPYVALSYVKNAARETKSKFDLTKEQNIELKKQLKVLWKSNKHMMNPAGDRAIIRVIKGYLDSLNIEYTEKQMNSIILNAYDDTYDDTFQAMEGLVHNLNTMHSRAGAQVPFSSVNYGTDTSKEGQIIQETLLKTTWDGLGNGETPIFPIQILKLKKGVNVESSDPLYYIFELACKVSAKSLYPNFVNLDAPYNKELYIEGHPETEMATMGCVEQDEIIEYAIGKQRYIEPFGIAYDRIKWYIGEELQQGNSNYIDTEGANITIKDSYTGRFVRVKKFIRNTNVNNFRVLKMNNGFSITLTGDHPLPVLGKGRTFVDNIRIGDKLEVDTNITVDEKPVCTTYFGSNNDTAWLLGVLLTDSAYSSSQITASIGMDESEIIDKIQSITDKLGYRLYINEQHRGTKGDYIDASIREISGLKYARQELSELFGGYNKNDRYITSGLLNSPKEFREYLLAGLIDGDGSVAVSKERNGGARSSRFSLGSTNKKLALTELYLIRSLGIKAKLMRNKYSSRHNKIHWLIEFEITDSIINKVVCAKKSNDVKHIQRCKFSTVDVVEVVEIQQYANENEESTISYDVETESDRFDVSCIRSHNCRTRVGTNKYAPDKQVIPGRGNLSFTSINLPRLGIKARGNIELFYKMLDSMMEIVHTELLERLAIISKRRPINYPFLMGQNCWLDSDKLAPADQIGDVWKHGTLTVGFIGLAETLVALTGKHHGESEESQKLGLEIVQHMRDVTDRWSDEEHLNYSIIGTPAEGLSGRFIRADKKLFGIIPGVTDRGYYTNSSHVPVYYPISAKKKIDIEAPYHAIENGGHIAYIEMDGDPTKNVKAFMKVVRYMYDKNMGYMAVNHAVDRDPVCGYVGIIDDVCPRCGRHEGEPMSIEMWNKLKGFANVGNADTLGYHGNTEEEEDRIPNKFDI